MAWALLPLGMSRDCASHECRGVAAWELDAGGVASHHCETCKTIIERGEIEAVRGIDRWGAQPQ